MIHPKKMIVVLGVSALALGPFGGVTPFFGDDVAYAGNGNGGGNGGGNGAGNGGGNKGGAANKGGERSSSGGTSFSGKSKEVAAPARERTPGSKARATTTEDEGTTFAARDLGNMNGALNANMNAVMAHVRNGNTNGPVGALAGLMMADAGLGALNAEDVVARAEAWAAYDEEVAAALGDYASVGDYLADRTAEAAYGEWETRSTEYQDALASGDPNTDSLNPGPAPFNPDFTANSELDALLESPPEGSVPDDGELAAVDAVTEAERAVLAEWNKNPDTTDEITTEERAVLDSLRARYSDEDLAEIAEASGS